LLTTSNKSADILKDSAGNPIGIKGSIRNKKNKVSVPFRECEFRVIYDKGLDPLYGILPLLVGEGKLTKNGAWYVTASGTKFQESQFNDGKIKLSDILGDKAAIMDGAVK
jgi:recombination protein RecA